MSARFYKSRKTGSYYGIENGELIQYAMNRDESIDLGTKCSVDWDFLATEPQEVYLHGELVSLYRYVEWVKNALVAGFGIEGRLAKY